MAISGLQVIGVGLQNESANSDSLYTAFTKTKENFNTLFANASPFNTYNGNTGISITANAVTGVVDVTNTGVTQLIAGTGVVIDQSTGNITISSTGGGSGAGGTVTSVGLTPVSTDRLVVTNSPIVSAGAFGIDLATTGVTPGAYVYPTMTVDQFGRVSAITSGASVGTMTSLSVTPGAGIQVTGSPVTTSGTINIINTGVTKLTAGTGMSISASTGEVTISTTLSGGTVTSVGISSTSLVVLGGAITTTGTIAVDLPTTMNIVGSITGGNLLTSGKLTLSGGEDLANLGAVSLTTTSTYFTTAAAETATMAVGTAGQIKTFMMVGRVGNMVITATNPGWGGAGTMTFSAVGQGCTMQYINSAWFCIGNNGVVFA